jgi:hypothetical protein
MRGIGGTKSYQRPGSAMHQTMICAANVLVWQDLTLGAAYLHVIGGDAALRLCARRRELGLSSHGTTPVADQYLMTSAIFLVSGWTRSTCLPSIA